MLKVYNQIKELYGELPKEAVTLLKIAYIKNLCQELGVKRVLVNATTASVQLYKIAEIMPKKMGEALSGRKTGVLKFEDVPIISFDLGLATMQGKIDFILQFLKESK